MNTNHSDRAGGDGVPDVVTLLDQIQSIARTGLEYSNDGYDRERYSMLLEVSTRAYADLGGLTEAEVRGRFARETGYQTAKVGADAAIFDAEDRILLVRRVDDGAWGLVAGWVEPGEHPVETVVREAAEEVGLEFAVDRFVDIVARRASAAYGPHGVLSVLYLCSVLGGELRVQPHEVHEARYWAVDAVPVWHLNHEAMARRALAARREG